MTRIFDIRSADFLKARLSSNFARRDSDDVPLLPPPPITCVFTSDACVHYALPLRKRDRRFRRDLLDTRLGARRRVSRGEERSAEAKGRASHNPVDFFLAVLDIAVHCFRSKKKIAPPAIDLGTFPIGAIDCAGRRRAAF